MTCKGDAIECGWEAALGEAEERIRVLSEELRFIRACAVPMDPPASHPIEEPLASVIVRRIDRVLASDEGQA